MFKSTLSRSTCILSIQWLYCANAPNSASQCKIKLRFCYTLRQVIRILLSDLHFFNYFFNILFKDGTQYEEDCNMDTDTCSQDNTICIAGVCKCDHDFKYDETLGKCGRYSSIFIPVLILLMQL